MATRQNTRPAQAGFFMADQNRKGMASAADRGYGGRWQKARATFLREHPLCADHLRRGRYVEATVVDHIKPHRGDQSLFWDTDNWQALCASCHSRHKQRAERSGVEVGCDVSGIPADPTHHWNR